MTCNRPNELLLSFFALILASGCFFNGPTGGERRRANFAYEEGILGCLFGCDLDAPIAAHSNTVINVDERDESDPLPAFDAVSTDTSVLDFSQSSGSGDRSIDVRSHVAGSAYLELYDGSEELVDRVWVEVRDIATIELGSPGINSRYLIMLGGSGGLRLDLLDASGDELKGYGGVEYALSGGISQTQLGLLADAIARAFVGSTSESLRLDALALGVGSVVVTAPSGAMLTIPVEVVDESAASSATVSGDTTAQPGESATLDASVFASDGEEIHDPACAWTMTPISGEVTISSTGRNSVTVSASSAGSASLTCTVGSAIGSATVTFQAP